MRREYQKSQCLINSDWETQTFGQWSEWSCIYIMLTASQGELNDFQLTREESDLIRRHLNRIVQIDRKIADLSRELEIECNALETAWQNAYRRNLLDKMRRGMKINDKDFHVPPAIENGELKLILTEEHRTRVVKK